MKRRAIFTMIAVIISVYLVSSFAGVNVNSSAARFGTSGLQPTSKGASQPAGTASTPYPSRATATPAPLDPNVVYAAIKVYPGLDKQLRQVGRGSRTEVAEWRRLQESLTSATAVDNRSRMTREVQKQVALELGFIRQIAVEEGAKKTVAAIDGVLLYRQSRLEKLNKQLQEDRRSARTTSSSTRSSRGRTGRSRFGTGTELRSRYTPRNRNGTEDAITEGATTTSGSTRRRR